jgi:hypothetical protein
MKENRFNVNLRNPWWEEQRNEDEVIFSNIRISRIFLAESIEMSLQKNKHGDESRLWRQTKERRQIHAHYQQLSNCEMHFSVSATDRDADFMPPPPTPILMPFRNDLGAAQFQRSSMSSKVYHSKQYQQSTATHPGAPNYFLNFTRLLFYCITTANFS